MDSVHKNTNEQHPDWLTSAFTKNMRPLFVVGHVMYSRLGLCVLFSKAFCDSEKYTSAAELYIVL